MPTVIANISWSPVPGSFGTLVEYRLGSSSTWITPTSPANPTIYNTYPIEIQTNTEYYVRISSIGGNCQPSYRIRRVFLDAGTCCPSGYTLSMDGEYCFQVNTTAATPPSNPQNTVAKTLDVYNTFGTLIYDSGFNVNGTGPFTQISYTNPFWVNGAGYPSVTGNLSDGPLNRTGLWTSTSTPGQVLGFTVCIEVPSSGIYYVGSSADNFTTISVDGAIVLQMDVNAMATFLQANGYPTVDLDAPFRFWHVYPVFLNAGQRIVEIIGNNEAITPPPNPAAVGVEIYNATSAEIQAATSYIDLDTKLIFSSKDYIGQPVQVGNEGFGYTCPTGYSLVLCDGPAYCTQTLTTATIPCPTTTTTSTSSTTTTTTTTAPLDTVYYGVKSTGTTPTEAEILAGSSILVDASQDVTINWVPIGSGLPDYCWFAIPSLGPSYDKNRWFVDAGNNGNIGDVTDLFGAPSTVVVSGTAHLVWITNYQTEFTDPCILSKE